MGTIVIGVDGSECSRAALAFAAEEAALRSSVLRVVSAWEVPPAVYAGGLAPVLDQGTLDGLRENAQSVVDEAVAEAVRLQPSVHCEGATLEGQAAEVLLREAEGATLIVVGNRGRGGFASLMLGSVSQQIVHHAPCPVLIIRAAER